MKILFVCQQYIHAARWIGQLKEAGHEIHVFDCLDREIHPELLWTTYYTNWSKRKLPNLKGEYFLEKKMPSVYSKIAPYLKVTASEKLEELIKEIKPDLVHSLEMQSQTYPLLKVRKKIHFNWAYFSWGSDLYLYQNNASHQQKIKEVLSKVNYLFIDNSRDIKLAKSLDYKGETMPVFPGGGGYSLEEYKQYLKPVSERKLIIIKGYHHWAGRALSVLNALEILIETIKNYEIYVYSAHDLVIDKIDELNLKYNLNIKYSSRKNEITHQALLEKFGSAKIAIGNSISDGIPNTLLEAIILGAFPIQSNPGGASEDYILDGKNGFLINNPENSEEISKIIYKALKDDEMLEKAFLMNQQIAEQLEYKTIKTSVLKNYAKIESEL